MRKQKISWLAIALLALAICLVGVQVMAGTVLVQTSSGAGACATYYTQPGDWATGDATVSGTGAVDLTTQGSVEMGLVRSETAGGDRAFAPFTGDFTASTGGGAATAASTNPRVDIFVVSQPNSTLGTYTIDGTPGGIPYGTIQGAVDASTTGADPDPNRRDWVLVDQGTYLNEAVTIDDEGGSPTYNGPFEDNLALTSVWGRDDTIIDGAGTTGDGVEVSDVPGFRIEGFTLRDSEDEGINVDDSPDARIVCNTIINADEEGIDVDDSAGVWIMRNSVTGNDDDAGIDVQNCDDARIENNTVTDADDEGIRVRDSDDARIINNTVINADDEGIEVDRSDRVWIMHNSVSGNDDDPGIDVDNCDDARIENNTVTDAGDDGIYVVDSDDARIINNTVTDAGDEGILVEDSDGVQIRDNTVTDSRRHGISIVDSDDAQITGNTCRENHGDGLLVNNSANVRITRNNIIDNGSAFGGITLTGAATTVTALNQNNIEGNHNWGLQNNTINAINATNNWWGDASGPSGEGPGTGDAIQNTGGGSVTYDPWRTTPAP